MEYLYNSLNKKYYYTDDDWKTYNIADDYNSRYTKETRKDYLTLVKLYFWFEKSQAMIIYDELKKIREKLVEYLNHPIENDGYGSSFEVLSIAIKHDIEYDKIIQNNIVHGEYDGGIDAIVEQNQTVYVYQIKFDDNVSPTCLNDNRKLINDYIFNELTDPLAKHLKDFLDDKKINFDYPTEYYCVTNKPSNGANINSKDLLLTFLGRKFISSYDNQNLTLCLKKVGGEESVAKIFKDTFVFANAYDFCESLNNVNEKDRIFEDNVRRGLEPSESIIDTIKKEGSYFHLFNNGISICCDRFVDGTRSYTIYNPMIINGQQTIRTLDYIYLGNIEDVSKEKLKKVYIPIFIKEVSNKSIKYKIAKYNNTQKAIQENDFMALDENARRFQKFIYIESTKRHTKKYSFPILFLNLISNGKDSKIINVKNTFEQFQIIDISDFLRLILTINNCLKIYSYKNSKNFKYDSVSKNALKCVKEKKLLDIAFSISEYKRYLATIPKNDAYYNSYLAANLLIQYTFYMSLLKNRFLKIEDCFEYVKQIQDNFVNNGNDPKDIVKFYKKKEVFDYFDFETLNVK